MAEEVLEKYYPKPKHIWKHGDVFNYGDGSIMMYLEFCGGRVPEVVLLRDKCPDIEKPAKFGNVEKCLENAEFLFNIKEKL